MRSLTGHELWHFDYWLQPNERLIIADSYAVAPTLTAGRQLSKRRFVCDLVQQFAFSAFAINCTANQSDAPMLPAHKNPMNEAE